MRPNPGDFTTEFVVASLEEAGRTLLSLSIRGARPAGYRSNMPEIVREAVEAYGYSEETLRPPTPSSRAISDMDWILGWVSLIPTDKFVMRRIVHARSLINPISGRHIYSWRKLAIFLRCDRDAAQRWHAHGIATIVARLNQPGLCALAGGQVGPGTKLVNEALAHIKAAQPAKRKQITAVEYV